MDSRWVKLSQDFADAVKKVSDEAGPAATESYVSEALFESIQELVESFGSVLIEFDDAEEMKGQ